MKVKLRLDSHVSFKHKKLKLKDSECFKELKETFTHVNPTFYKNQRMGIPCDPEKEPRQFKSYSIQNGRITFNRGCYKKIKKILKAAGHIVKINNERLETEDQIFNSKIVLRAEQKPAVTKALKKKQGIIRGPCASGKSVIGLEIIAQSKQVGTVIVWNTSHQEQWIEEALRSDLLNISLSDIGGVGGIFSDRKKWNKLFPNDKFPGKRVGKLNICMQQSLWREDNREMFTEVTGCLVADEIQRFAARTFKVVLNSFQAVYRIGLSANEKRKDGKECLIYDAVGEIIHIIPDTNVGSRKKSKIYLVPTKYENDEYEFTKRTPELLNDMARDKSRNKIIIRRAKKKASKKKLVLILVERKYQALYLREKLLAKKLKVKLLVGKTTKKEIREADDWNKSWKTYMSDKYDADLAFQIVKKLGTKKKIDVIIATQKGDVGISIKTIDHLIITTPTGGNLERFNQQKGRVERNYDRPLIKKYGPKKTPTVDYMWDIRNESIRKKGENILRNFSNVNVLTKKKTRRKKNG